MGLLPDTQNCGLRMLRVCREHFPRQGLEGKPLILLHVPWCKSGSLTRGGGENVPGISGACATRNFTYLAKGPWHWAWQSWLISKLYPTSDLTMLTLMTYRRFVGKISRVYRTMTAKEAEIQNFPNIARNMIAAGIGAEMDGLYTKLGSTCWIPF